MTFVPHMQFFLIVTKRKDTIGNFQILWVLNCNFIEFEIWNWKFSRMKCILAMNLLFKGKVPPYIPFGSYNFPYSIIRFCLYDLDMCDAGYWLYKRSWGDAECLKRRIPCISAEVCVCTFWIHFVNSPCTVAYIWFHLQKEQWFFKRNF